MISRRILGALGLMFAFLLPFTCGSNDDIEVSLANGTIIHLRKVGCYRDTHNRALRNRYHDHRSRIIWRRWPDMTYVVKACARRAFLQHIPRLFGVQFYGECWGDVDPSRYNIYGLASNCIHGVGEHWSNYVYSMIPCTTKKLNLAFVVDGSGSINNARFGRFREFVKKMAESFPVSATNTQVATVVYSEEPELIFNFGKYNDINEIKTAVDNMPYHGKTTHTGKALKFTLEEVFKKARKNVKNVLIALTDGHASDLVKKPAQAVRDYGIEVFAVGVGSPDIAELEEIATDPDKDHVFNVDFDEVSNITGGLENQICTD